MEGLLTKNQIEYVLFHLKHHFEADEILLDRVVYKTGSSIKLIDQKKVVFNLSHSEIRDDVFLDYKGDQLPVLFPGDQDAKWYRYQDGTLVFHHDLLKSAFYLLSGYQETQSKATDEMDRFLFKESIQQKLGIVTKPIVNYYFDVILDGLETYCKHHQIHFKRKRLFDSFGFMLTHDVDRVDYYHWRETIYRFMQLLGLKKAHYPKKRLVKAAFHAVLPTLFPSLKNDPWWNFESLRKQERELEFSSVWYFLNRDGSPHDAKYGFMEKRIQTLIDSLQKEGCEIGLHGSIKTATSHVGMAKAYSQLQRVCEFKIQGARQHFLKSKYPQTLKIQQDAGLKYDTTMGFAEHEGFRNSYCYPFKPFDHENDAMLDIWEFPLVMMDTTLFGYRQLSYPEMLETTQNLMKEIARFGGLFVLLWHNCNFDEYEYPEITNLYSRLLQLISSKQPVSVSGVTVLDKINAFS